MEESGADSLSDDEELGPQRAPGTDDSTSPPSLVQAWRRQKANTGRSRPRLDLYSWHRRLGHVHPDKLVRMAKAVDGLDIDESTLDNMPSVCGPCTAFMRRDPIYAFTTTLCPCNSSY